MVKLLPAEAGRFQIAGLILKREEIGLTYIFFVTKLGLHDLKGVQFKNYVYVNIRGGIREWR
jgi:hypothetical protein